jgi:hypothetical protein
LAIERASWYVDGLHGRLKITFSDRTNFSKVELRNYIELEMNKSGSQIRPVLDPQKIEIKNIFDERLLQLPDHCASSFAEAFEPDRYGNTHPYYADEFSSKFYSYKEKTLWIYGIKVMPNDKVSKSDFIETFPFSRKWFVK